MVIAQCGTRQGGGIHRLSVGGRALQIAMEQLPDGIAVEPSGRYGYVANTDSQTISVVDLGRFEVVAELPTKVGMSGLIWRTTPVVALRS